MHRHLRIRLLAVAAIAIVAAAVWLVGNSQRSTADEAALGTESAQEMESAILSQGFHLVAYAGTGDSELLDHYRHEGRRFESALATTGEDSASDPGRERRLFEAQARAARRWERVADGIATRIATRGPRGLSPAVAERLDVAFERFAAANEAFRAEIEKKRQASHAAVGRLTTGVMLVLSGLFGLLAYLFFDRPGRLEESRRGRHAGFAEVMQLARSETEAYRIVKRHLERIVPGGRATVLNRNNSANRLEAATSVDDPALASALEGAEPESCIAVRSGRVHRRVGHGEQLLTCEVCGATGENTTCMPSLVGGEVIGSVLIEHDELLDDRDHRYLSASITESAPIVANLRNLAVAEMRASTDALTGLPNNRSVQETLRRMAAQAGRTVTPLAAVLFDLDRFKQINDMHGHARGDEVLAAVGDAARSAVRTSDFVGRYGGEEFLALLPDTGREGAFVAAEKLSAALHELNVPGISSKITASFGVAVLPDDARDPEELLRKADRALYTAKAKGRDRIEMVIAKEEGPTTAPPEEHEDGRPDPAGPFASA
jgi:diguanylate cyclase (GGDEF)-like protein